VPRCHSERSELPVESLANARFDSISFEPQSAIFADDNGTEIIKRFLKSAPDYLNNHGTILIELDPRNAIEIKKSATQSFPKAKIRLEKDLAGFWRYLSIQN
jgi:release factor glutamine methyltransferase